MTIKHYCRTALFFFALTAALSCSHHDDDNNKEAACQPTNIIMDVNGVTHKFQATGRGIGLLPDGSYKLELWGDGYDTDMERNIYIKMPYQKTGSNVMQQFKYGQSGINGVSGFSGDFVTQQFECNVTVNRATCFYATFSGTFTANGQTVTITNGIFSYTYEDSF